MENVNFQNDAIVDPRDAEIAELTERLANANRVRDAQFDQLDQLGDAILGLIGDKVEALAESVADKIVERALDDFDVSSFEYEIGEMIDERLPEGLDDESRADDLKAAIREVLHGSTVTLDIE
tara:strand:+ start:73 stop:441 length:369 start_codon:yes stop_codon:yes gene_type:complete